MKIAYIIHGTFNSAGMERVLSIKANYFAEKEGYEVFIITTDQKQRQPYYPLSEKIKQYDLSVNFEDYYDYPLLKRIYSFVFKQRKCYQLLTKLLLELKADIVVSLMSRTITFLPRVKDGSKKIYEQHFNRNYRNDLFNANNAGMFQRFIYKFRAVQEKRNLTKMDHFVVLTQEDAKLWGKIPNIKVIPNPLSFYPEFISNVEACQVISVGRLEHQKGYDRMASIWSRVHQQFPNWKMLIIGVGKDLPFLQQQINFAKLENVITIVLPTQQVIKELLNSSIYLMTSRYEGFPMVLIEAMACGLPAISFNCPCGPSEIITEGEDGFIVNNHDIEAMAFKLCLLMKDEKLRKTMGLAAHENIKRYSQEEVMKQWVALFNELHN